VTSFEGIYASEVDQRVEALRLTVELVIHTKVVVGVTGNQSIGMAEVVSMAEKLYSFIKGEK
jgi:hypothetical protein